MNDRRWGPGNPVWEDIEEEKRMAVEHNPMYGANDEPLEVYEEGALQESVTVPLVIYVNGERKVIGEATLVGNEIKAVIGEQSGQEVIDLIWGRRDEARFSFGFSRYPNPYREPPDLTETVQHLPLPPYKKRFHDEQGITTGFDEMEYPEIDYLIPETKYQEHFPFKTEEK